MPTWDKGRPIGAEAWNLGGVRIRDNFDYLDAALKQIATFAQNASSPTSNLFTKVGIGVFASRPNLAAAAATGIVYFATDTLRWYICTDGAANIWTEVGSLSGALAIAGALTVTGLITANGGLTVPIGQNLTSNGVFFLSGGASISGGNVTLQPGNKIVVPNESWLRKSGGTEDMDPHEHQVRHMPGATNGAWTALNDFLPFHIQQIRHSVTLLNTSAVSITTLASQTFGAAGAAKCEVTLDTTGRPTTSRGILYGEFGWTNDDQQFLTAGLYRASAAGLVGAVGTLLGGMISIDSPYPSTSAGMIGVLRYVQGLAAGATHRFALHAEDTTNGDKFIPTVQLTYLDLGTE